MDVPAGVTQEGGHTGFLHPSSAVLALMFLARRNQPSLSLVGSDGKFLSNRTLRIESSAEHPRCKHYV